MTKDTITSLIIGGAIGFFFSFLASLIAFVVQIYRDHQSKKWETEKIQRDDAKTIVLRRMDIMESQTSIVMEHYIKAFTILESVS